MKRRIDILKNYLIYNKWYIDNKNKIVILISVSSKIGLSEIYINSKKDKTKNCLTTSHWEMNQIIEIIYLPLTMSDHYKLMGPIVKGAKSRFSLKYHNIL